MITTINEFKIYENFILSDYKLNEGLIMTHDIYQSVDALNKKIFIDGNAVAKGNKIEVIINNVDFNNFLSFLTLSNNLGYYIAYLKVYFKTGLERKTSIAELKDKNLFNYDFFVNKLNKLDLTLEPKYDLSHKLKTNKLYHVTEERFLDRIFKNGLMSKSYNTKTEYPERVYTVYNLDDANEYIRSKKSYYMMTSRKLKEKDKYFNTKFIILEINLPNDNNLIFYEDPNFKGKGIYTYDSIDSKYIKLLE